MRLGYVHLPRFPVQRCVLERPSLASKPLLLHADERGVQRVCFASGAALKAGVRVGHTVAAAAALVPSAARLSYDGAAEARALATLGEALMGLAPGFELCAPEGLWLDASAAHLSGGEVGWTRRVLETCAALGFRGRCVVAEERFTAQALAVSAPRPPGPVPPRGGPELASLPLSALEVGWLGEGAAAPFRALGLTTLGEVSALSAGALVARFGALGLTAARLCRGEDDSRFVAAALPERLEERVALDWPAEQLEPILFALKLAVDRLCARLQGRQLAAVRLSVALTLADGSVAAVPLVFARPTSQARTMVELIRHQLTELTVTQPVSALAVAVDEAGPERGRQLLLGDEPAGEAELEVVLSRLQSALGEDALFSARVEARHRPEEGWTRTAFRPPDARSSWQGERLGEQGTLAAEVPPAAPEERPPEPAPLPPDVRPLPDPLGGQFSWVEALVGTARQAKRDAGKEEPQISEAVQAARPVRLFPEASALRAEVTEEGLLCAVVLLGRRRRVESLWGPERLVGDWWAASTFARDYYRVQLEGVGVLWVYRDGADGRFYAQGVFD